MDIRIVDEFVIEFFLISYIFFKSLRKYLIECLYDDVENEYSKK